MEGSGQAGGSGCRHGNLSPWDQGQEPTRRNVAGMEDGTLLSDCDDTTPERMEGFRKQNKEL